MGIEVVCGGGWGKFQACSGKFEFLKWSEIGAPFPPAMLAGFAIFGSSLLGVNTIDILNMATGWHVWYVAAYV